MAKQYDYLIVGAGLFGSVFAAEMQRRGRSVYVIDKRHHIGGNCYTAKQDGFHVHKYGPHILHTNNARVWKYVNQFAKFGSFTNRPKVCYNGRFYSFPINLMTINQVLSTSLKKITSPDQARAAIEDIRCCHHKGLNFEDWLVSRIGYRFYEMFYKDYTKKLWGVEPKELPADFAKRIPIRFDFNDDYYDDVYQGIPVDGYTQMLVEMLGVAQIDLNVDYFDSRKELSKVAKTIVYTGRMDEFFDYEFGKLDYRQLRFDMEYHAVESYQGTAVINYPEAQFPYIRVTEHKYFYKAGAPFTIITKEVPVDSGGVDCYPVRTKKNLVLLAKYQQHAEDMFPSVIFGGRLATFQYLNMDEVVLQALKAAANET